MREYPSLWSISPLFCPVNGRNPRIGNFRKDGILRFMLKYLLLRCSGGSIISGWRRRETSRERATSTYSATMRACCHARWERRELMGRYDKRLTVFTDSAIWEQDLGSVQSLSIVLLVPEPTTGLVASVAMAFAG